MRGFRRRVIRWPGGVRLPRVQLPFWWLLLVALLVGFAVVERMLTPVLSLAAEEKARAVALETINRAVMERVAVGLQQKELVQYRYDQQGHISLLSINTPLVNQVAADSAIAAQDAIGKLAESKFAIPLGQALGSKLLANLGPDLPVHFTPLGTAQVTVGQRFVAAGINQTRHVVYLQATARLRVLVPLVVGEVTVTSELPLAENVIVGPVPQSYWQGAAGVITGVPGAVPETPGVAPGP